VFAELRRLGCDEVQGFLFSPAVPAAQALALMDRPLAVV
jgi:EAL domain-containing protein (putative c-di-GMP-specific phosphodiesterase class I)